MPDAPEGDQQVKKNRINKHMLPVSNERKKRLGKNSSSRATKGSGNFPAKQTKTKQKQKARHG